MRYTILEGNECLGRTRAAFSHRLYPLAVVEHLARYATVNDVVKEAERDCTRFRGRDVPIKDMLVAPYPCSREGCEDRRGGREDWVAEVVGPINLFAEGEASSVRLRVILATTEIVGER